MLVTVMAAAGWTAGAQEFRTDINPALRYYQAMIMGAELAPADHDYLFTNEWRGQPLPARFGELMDGGAKRLRAVREAGRATVPCDWGIDLSAGPETLLPHLGRCKALGHMALLRVLWELQEGKEAEAREDLAATYALARNTSRDGTLIAALVQCALENMVMVSVAENYYRLSGATLQELSLRFDTAPARGSMAAAIVTGEKECSHFWLERHVAQWQKENPGDDTKVMEKLRTLFKTFGDDSGSNAFVTVLDKLGTSEAMLKMLRDEDPFYERAAEIMTLPHGAFEKEVAQFTGEVERSGNPMLMLTFPSVLKSRQKEFEAVALREMARAAVAYKMRGPEGLRTVNDPFGHGPFQYERFLFQGVDRGFKLTSAYAERGFAETAIFVESAGPSFHCVGPSAGQPLSK